MLTQSHVYQSRLLGCSDAKGTGPWAETPWFGGNEGMVSGYPDNLQAREQGTPLKNM